MEVTESDDTELSTRSVSAVAPSTTATSMVNNGKNEIKLSDEGVAKLSFSFLDEMQGDSSLEPGEVKTPPPGSSPASTKDSTPMRTTKPEPPAKQLARETVLAKALKTVSQMEAEACEEKVRLILELDAKRRREEKLLSEKRRQNEDNSNKEEKEKSREERKKLRKLKKGEILFVQNISLIDPVVHYI